MAGKVRKALPEDCKGLADLWFDGWRDAHAAIVPKKLIRQRTLPLFRRRMIKDLDLVRTVDDATGPVGFTLCKDDELNQMYVAERARGGGYAKLLMEDAERHFVSGGVKAAWLACAIGNDRAARFYEKAGWKRAGTVKSILDLPEGPFVLDVWRYEKNLHPIEPY